MLVGEVQVVLTVWDDRGGRDAASVSVPVKKK